MALNKNSNTSNVGIEEDMKTLSMTAKEIEKNKELYAEWDKSGMPIPYDYSLWGFRLKGTLYVTERPEDSYTKGLIIFIAKDLCIEYELNRHRQETKLSVVFAKVVLRLNFDTRELQWRICYKKFPKFAWKCRGWNRIVKF